MKNFISQLRKAKLVGSLVHTLDYCLQRELTDCETVLDLGCGPSSPVQYCKNIRHSIGVEAFEPYLKAAQILGTHTQYLAQRLENLDFPEASFDAIIMIEVLEHLSEEMASEAIKKAEKWARKKVIISTPNGYFPMGAVDGNSLQRHLSGWSVERLEKLGFECHGVSGFKALYLKENAVHSLTDQADNIFANMRFRPKKLFYLINGLLQIGVYFFPRVAFGLFAVKNKNV